MKAANYVPVMIVAFAAIMAIAGSASAQQVCVGQPARFALEVENTGSQDDTYIITPSDPSWIDVPASIFIEKDTTEVIDVIVTAPKVGSNPFYLMVTSSHGYEDPKKVSASVTALECRDVSVVASPSAVDACQSQPAVFKIFVKNGGQAPDTFDLSATRGSLQKTKVELDAGESEEINLVVDTREMEGEYKIVVSAFSGSVSDSTKMTMNVMNCYSAEMSLTPSEASVCACGSADFTVSVKNTGRMEDEYLVNIDDEMVKSVVLLPDETAMMNYSVAVRCGSGTRDVRVTVESENTALEETATINIKPVEECYSLDISTQKSKADVARCSATDIGIDIANDGHNTQLFRINLQAPEWVHISRESAYLEPGEEMSVYLYISPEIDTEVGTYDIKLNVTGNYFAEIMEIPVQVHLEGTQVEDTGSTGDSGTTDQETGSQDSGDQDSWINMSLGDNITGGVVAVGIAPLWKAIVISLITIIIIAILVVRFAILVKK